MLATAYTCGKKVNFKSTFGLRINENDRDKFFKQNWKSVQLIFEGSGNPVEVNITPSFWRSCPGLRSKQIGLWFNKLGCTKWPKFKTPKFVMEPKGGKTFFVRPL